MRFSNTLILLAALVAATAVPLFVGHGWSSHHTEWIVYGGVAAIASAALFFLHMRLLSSRSD